VRSGGGASVGANGRPQAAVPCGDQNLRREIGDVAESK
jgi:hypothetical protein